MIRLTPFAKLLLILVFIALAYFAAKFFLGEKMNFGNNDSNTTQTEQTTSTDRSTSGTNAGSSNKEMKEKELAKTSTNSSFDYTPAKLIGGKLMGVVELGASGFNSFIIRKDNSDNWEKVKYEWGNSLVADGLASNQDVTTGLKKYISNILDFGVSGKDVHFVVSSGAMKEPAIVPIVKGLKDLGYFVNQVTPEQEGEYALRSVLPKEFENSAFVVDIGSGNTKVSWIDGGRIAAKEAVGAKYYTKGVSVAQAYSEANKIGKMVPRRLAKTCFIIGGVPFNLAKESRNGDERFTILGDPSAYSKLADEKGEKISSGLNIYQGLKDGSGCDKFIFDWDANFTIGFLLTLPG